MIGIDDHAATVVGDWAAPSPSPRTFFSSILADDFGSRSFSELVGGGGGGGGNHIDHEGDREGIPLPSSSKQKQSLNLKDDTRILPTCDDHLLDSTSFSTHKSNSQRSLAERMAARAGFTAPMLNTARLRSATNLSSPGVPSPYLTIPPGLSPTTLLDSPVFLSNSLAQPSPTTGKFSFDPSNGKTSMFVPATRDRDKDNLFEDDTSSFVFKPHVELNSSHVHCASNKETPATNSKQPFPSIEVLVQSEHSLQLPSIESAEVHSRNQKSYNPWADLSRSSIERGNDGNDLLSDPVTTKGEGSPQLDDPQDGEGDQRSIGELNSTVVNATSSEDGYNWRKYGQKQVKGSECPRSYYKCTHPTCQVKKKVERSHEGHITEIIYKGAHNHPKPPPNRRTAVGSSNPQNDVQLDIPESAMTQVGVDGDRVWSSLQGGPVAGCHERKHDTMEVTSSASVGPALCDPSTSMQAEKVPHFEAAVDVSATLSNDEDEDDEGTPGSVSLGCDGDGDETESKRRKIEAMEMGGVARAIREPRVVVQTASEVDILDDGYRWRKYGQKVVKGNPNPRSYYKCTNAGCTVRKHVERASHDLKSVITTYEGKHNHDVPAARNSSHISSGASSTVPMPSAQSRAHKPEPSQVHDSMTRFDGPVSLGTCIVPGRQQLRPLPDFTFSMSQPGLANLSMAGASSCQRELPSLSVHLHPYLAQQQHQVKEVGGFMLPKGEPKYEPVSEHGLNASNGSLVYHQMMSRLPLGPQTQ